MKLKKISTGILALAALFIGCFSFPVLANSGTFPETDTFNGMQIVYSISGVSVDSHEDVNDFTTSRGLTGTITGKTVTVTGTVKQDNGYSAHIEVRVGDQNYTSDILVGESDSFTLSCPITKDMDSISVSIAVGGSYNAGGRGLTVAGSFSNPKYVAPKTDASGTTTTTSVPTEADKINVIFNSNATNSAGEVAAGVLAVIVVGVLSTVAAVGSAGAASGASGSSEETTENNEEQKSYKLCIYKDFGDAIRYDKQGVPVYARMVEISKDGAEANRFDLTQRIEIFSGSSAITVRDSATAGDYMGAFIEAVSVSGSEKPKEGIVSFRFSGEGGTFQNNVTFRLIGDCMVELPAEKLYLLATSGESFTMPYNLVDFTDEAKVTINIMQGSPPISLETGVDSNNQTIIIATDRAEIKPIERFYDSYACEIIAENEKEYARTVFYTVLCYEGILPDFLGKEKEILAYQNEEGEMPTTGIAFRLGVWNKNTKSLDTSRPETLEIEYTDEQGIFELIGLNFEVDSENSTSDYLLYKFKAEKSLPNSSPVPGLLTASYSQGEVSFESETTVNLKPDILLDERNWEKEYQNCLRIINTYLPPDFATKKRNQLEAGKDKMGISDLQLYRKKCWEMASRFIMQEKEDYMIASYWYDEAIATAELVVFVGDIALDVALAPFGGPIAGFVLGQVKSSLIDLISLRIEKGKIGYQEMYKFITLRLKQAAGQADGLVETPGMDKPKVLVAWLTGYFCYRVMYHWYFDLEDDGSAKGLLEALSSSAMDFAGKGAAILLGEYAKGIAKDRGIDIGSTADAEQKWVNGKVVQGFNAADNAARSLDKKIAEISTVLSDYIDRIKSGGVSFT